jgi:hypothetical protein
LDKLLISDTELEAAEKAYNDWCDETEEVAGERYCHEVPLRVAIMAFLEHRNKRPEPYAVTAIRHKNEFPIPPGTKLKKRPTQKPVHTINRNGCDICRSDAMNCEAVKSLNPTKTSGT